MGSIEVLGMVWHLSFWDQWLTALTVLNDCLPVMVVLSVAVVVEVYLCWQVLL